jgi:hypothetical protein
MKRATSLHLFQPPEAGDKILFDDGSVAVVSQDIGDGWYLHANGLRLCQSGFDMNGFIRAVLDQNRTRQGVQS